MSRSEQPRPRGKYGLYRLSIPMEEETYRQIELLSEAWNCTFTKAAQHLLKLAAEDAAADSSR